jgi:hypothetical protein
VHPSGISHRDEKSRFRSEASRLAPLEENLPLLTAIDADGHPGGFHGSG